MKNMPDIAGDNPERLTLSETLDNWLGCLPTLQSLASAQLVCSIVHVAQQADRW